MAFPSSEDEFRAFLTSDHPSLRRSRARFRLELRGVSEPVDVIVLNPGA